jgi:hypothetical protein
MQSGDSTCSGVGKQLKQNGIGQIVDPGDYDIIVCSIYVGPNVKLCFLIERKSNLLTNKAAIRLVCKSVLTSRDFSLKPLTINKINPLSLLSPLLQ